MNSSLKSFNLFEPQLTLKKIHNRKFYCHYISKFWKIMNSMRKLIIVGKNKDF